MRRLNTRNMTIDYRLSGLIEARSVPIQPSGLYTFVSFYYGYQPYSPWRNNVFYEDHEYFLNEFFKKLHIALPVLSN